MNFRSAVASNLSKNFRHYACSLVKGAAKVTAFYLSPKYFLKYFEEIIFSITRKF
jgi:hypothetical protein